MKYLAVFISFLVSSRAYQVPRSVKYGDVAPTVATKSSLGISGIRMQIQQTAKFSGLGLPSPAKWVHNLGRVVDMHFGDLSSSVPMRRG